MRLLNNSFKVSFSYPVHFTQNIFSEDNVIFRDLLSNGEDTERKILFVIDREVYKHHPYLIKTIRAYFKSFQGVELCEEILLVKGGEQVKNNDAYVENVIEAIERNMLCRHSFIAAVGGGAVLDMVGYASAITHRGIKHIRIPTTVLSQNDSGIGVKNGINAFGKKNFLGTFTPPYAVINDSSFLTTLEERDWRSGIAEAIKVALIKDYEFFKYIEKNTSLLTSRDMKTMEQLIFHCAELHMDHISGGDPFEKGSSRPLDFGHWSAHKLEQMTGYELRHGEAVAVGMALDATISLLTKKLNKIEWQRIISTILSLGFEIYVPELSQGLTTPGAPSIIKGLAEFREHLGGKLTIMLLEGIGKGIEVNQIEDKTIIESVEILKKYADEIKNNAEMILASSNN